MLATKYKRYPAYKNLKVEWMEEIPAHWEVRRLKHCVSFCNNKLDSKSEDAVYIGLQNMESWTGRLLLDNQPESVDSTVVVFNADDVLFGKLRPYLAKVACPNFNGTATSEVLVMRPLSECLQCYLAYCMLNGSYIHWINTLAYGTKMPRVSPYDVARSIIAFPPIAEQRAIATFLDRETTKIDALVSKKEQLMEILREKRAALITHAVSKGLDPNATLKASSVKWLGKIPMHWEAIKLKHLVSMQAGTGIISAEIDEIGEYPVFGGNGIRGHTSSFSHDGNYLLIGRQGALCGAIHLASGKFWATEHAVVVDPGKYVRADCLKYTLMAMSLNQYSQSAAQPGLNIEVIGNVLTPVPPLFEQQSITAFLDRETLKIDRLIDTLQKIIERLRELRTALISAAVTGRIDIRGEAECA